jgi:hypothetical protein
MSFGSSRSFSTLAFWMTLLSVAFLTAACGNENESTSNRHAEARSDAANETDSSSAMPDGGDKADASGNRPEAGEKGDGRAVGSVTLKGAVHKGPLILGSTVQAAMLNDSGNQTGEVFYSTTINELGQFELILPKPGDVELIGDGFYFNEIAGTLSGASITLHALATVTSSGTQNAYVNAVTHMAYRRALKLHREGAKLDEAIARAEGELRGELGIIYPGTNAGSGTSMNLLGEDTADNEYLFAVSCIVAEAASITGVSTDANLQSILNAIALDLEDDGQLDLARVNQLVTAEKGIDPSVCFNHLSSWLNGKSPSARAPDITAAWDTDKDGTANASDNDDDNDGVPDVQDCARLDPSRHTLLADGTTCAIESSDKDDDGITNSQDCNPQDTLQGDWCDPKTGLCWQVSEVGERLSWDNAVAYCNNLTLCNRDDWRLPSIKELVTIVDVTRDIDKGDIYIDASVFNSKSKDMIPPDQFWFWTSQSSVKDTNNAWYVYFKDGSVIDGEKTTSQGYARCVRGEAVFSAPFDASTVSGERVVKDVTHGLSWQGCAAGLSGDSCQQGSSKTQAWQEAVSYCDGLSWAGHDDWRLPGYYELIGIIDYTRYNPAVDVNAFTNIPASKFWSSSLHVIGEGSAWRVNFGNGDVLGDVKTSGFNAICVRNE